MEKVTLPKEMAKILEHYKQLDEFSRKRTEFLRTLVNDCEVEPKEKVLKHYKLAESNLHPSEDNSSEDAYLNRGILIGTKTTLDLLGIKIEGVNA